MELTESESELLLGDAMTLFHIVRLQANSALYHFWHLNVKAWCTRMPGYILSCWPGEQAVLL